MPIQRTEVKQPPRVTVDTSSAEGESVILPVSAKAVENDPSGFASLTEGLAFDAEKVNVLLSPSSDPNDSRRLIELWVNGKYCAFLRGEWKVVPRYFLYALARAKKQGWTFHYVHAANGTTRQTEHATQTQRYMFTVEDANPKGQKWLEQLMNEVV